MDLINDFEVSVRSENTPKDDLNIIVNQPVKNLAFYNKALSPFLKPEYFNRNPFRLGYYLSFIIGNLVLVYIALSFNLNILSLCLIGFLMGCLNAGLAFVSHELSHGSVVKGKSFQDLLVLFSFAPFLISPTYWRFWHNRLHHGNTQYVLKDPDAFPTMSVYKNSPFLRWVFKWTPGSKMLRSYSYFFFWFSFQSFLNQVYMRFNNKMWNEMNHKKVTIEFSLQIVMLISYLYLVGFSNWIYLFFIPFFVQNYILMSYISTNHNLSPLTKVNDPLVNSLSVSNYRLLEFLHLNFGYHVEHHIFPRMSGAYTKKVHDVLKSQFSENYQYMPKALAIKKLYSTARIYKNSTTLMHPIDRTTYSTIGASSK